MSNGSEATSDFQLLQSVLLTLKCQEDSDEDGEQDGAEDWRNRISNSATSSSQIL
jgi:hypothetical protein